MDTDTDTEMEPDVAELADGLARLLLKGERAVLRQQGTQEGLRRVQIDSNWGWAKRADEINSVRCAASCEARPWSLASPS